MPTLAQRWDARTNSFGLLRISLAFGVVMAHCWPLGFGLHVRGYGITSHQTDLGTFSLFGLLVVAGFLNTESGLRFTLRQYLWRRFLRIFPGFWTSLIVTAFVIAPAVAIYENGSLRGFWTHSEGPFSYVATNWFASMQQFPISGLLATTPFGRLGGGPSAFAGSLWSLRYEFGAYALLGLLMVLGVLHRSPRIGLGLAGLAYSLIFVDLFAGSGWAVAPPIHGVIGPFPLIGAFQYTWALYLGFMFLLGASARLYLHRVPVHGALAAAALALLVVSGWRGAFIAIGLPCYAYLILYAAVSLPKFFTRLARKRDYSFGVYIYAFPIQQTVALVGGAQFGIPVYITLCVVGTLMLAVPSWHLVERPALDLKNRTIVFRRRATRTNGRTDQSDDTGANSAGVQETEAIRRR